MSNIMLERSRNVKQNLSAPVKKFRGKLSSTLWPWRDWMTIGIGVLGASDPENHKSSDVLILVSDTLGSFGDEHSMDRLHKMFNIPENGVHAIAAGDMTFAAEIVPLISQWLTKYTEQNNGVRNYGAVNFGIAHALSVYKCERFRCDALPKLIPGTRPDWARMLQDFESGRLPHLLSRKMLKEWNKFDIGCQLIVGCFEDSGKAHIYLVWNDSTCTNCSMPGFVTIGTGGENAKFWLSYRNQHLGMPLKRSAYHAFEAKLMADRSPHVNQNLEFLVATKAEHFQLPKDYDKPGCPISIAELGALFLQYGPQATDALDPRSGHPV